MNSTGPIGISVELATDEKPLGVGVDSELERRVASGRIGACLDLLHWRLTAVENSHQGIKLSPAMPSRIAIIGWGSLIWDPQGIPIKGGWQKDGPILPIEFSRVSRDCRLTLVIDPEHGVETKTRFALSSRCYLKDAIEDLRAREKTKTENVGYLDRGSGNRSARHENSDSVHKEIKKWAEVTGVDAVVWTNLPSNFEKKNRRSFSVPNAIDFLRCLPDDQRKTALKYIANAPDEVDTPLRKTIREMNF